MDRVTWVLLATIIAASVATGQYFVGVVATGALLVVFDLVTVARALGLRPD
jgi:hypothetical protein